MQTAWLGVIALAVAVVAAVLVPTLLAIKRAASRAETVLMLIEREIRPMANQLQWLAEELRNLSQRANRELERVGTVAESVDHLSQRIGRLIGLVGTVGRIGQIVGTATGVKKGLDVFIAKLLSRNRTH
jgi:uncharacterized protein YoxC